MNDFLRNDRRRGHALMALSSITQRAIRSATVSLSIP
jgi:hypothetical protein